MARSFNQVTLMGNLTRDPELRQTPGGQNVCSFSLALNRSYKDASGEWVEATDYVDIVAWGPLGERVAEYLHKGRPCLVSGRLQSRQWEQEGVKRTKVEVNANDVTFLGGRDDDGAGQTGQVGQGGGNSGSRSAGASSGGSGSRSGGTSGGSKKKDDVVIEDIGDEPINLDDIPF
jgi:single-strand DNA-binding protein